MNPNDEKIRREVMQDRIALIRRMRSRGRIRDAQQLERELFEDLRRIRTRFAV